MNSDYAAASQSSAEDLNVDDDGDSEEDNFQDIMQSDDGQVEKVIQATEEDVEMTTQSDDEYDTLESRVQLVDLIAQDPTQMLNHNLNQAHNHWSLVSHLTIFSLPVMTILLWPPVSLMTYSMYKTGCFDIFPRCTLLLNHLRVS